MTDDTHREIGRRDGIAGELQTILMRRHYGAAIDDVWDACTDPERLGRFFMTPTGDLRVGGTFAFGGNAGGEILRCEPPRLLTVSLGSTASRRATRSSCASHPARTAGRSWSSSTPRPAR